MSSPSATAIFVSGASLLHLQPKFSVTITFTIMRTEFGNSAELYDSFVYQIYSMWKKCANFVDFIWLCKVRLIKNGL